MTILEFTVRILAIFVWPGVVVFSLILFRKEFSGFLKDLDEIKTQWFELRKIKEDNKQLRRAMQHTLEAWVYYLHANQQPEEAARKVASEKFSDTINEIADMIFETKEEKIEWANKPWFTKNKHD